jgi:transcriptional regulator with XRE-family HTH domain
MFIGGDFTVLHHKIVALRKSKKITQEELAVKVGVSRSALSQYELGSRQPDYDIVCRIADFFDVSVDYLLGRKLYIVSNKNQNDHILKEMVDKYNIDLSIEGTRDKLEQIVKLVFEQEDKKRQH